MNFNELVMNRIKTYQVHKNSLKFMNLFHELSWTSYKLILILPSSKKFMTVHEPLHITFVN